VPKKGASVDLSGFDVGKIARTILPRWPSSGRRPAKRLAGPVSPRVTIPIVQVIEKLVPLIDCAGACGGVTRRTAATDRLQRDRRKDQRRYPRVAGKWHQRHRERSRQIPRAPARQDAGEDRQNQMGDAAFCTLPG
jgi:hypothetical protein